MIADVVALFLTGFVSLIGQIVLLRELNVAFFGDRADLPDRPGGLASAHRPWGRSPADGEIPASHGRTATLFLAVLPLPSPRRRLPPGKPPGLGRRSRRLPPLSPADGGARHRARAGRTALGAPVPHRRRALCRKSRTLAGAYGIESAGALIGGTLAALPASGGGSRISPWPSPAP